MPARKLSTEEEEKRILEHYQGSLEDLSVMLDRQFQMLQARSYALLVVCGLLVTGSSLLGYGFPGMTFYNHASFLLRVGGGALSVAAAATLILGVMRLTWITQYPGHTIGEWLRSALELRNRKTKAFGLSSLLVLFSIGLYELSILFLLASANAPDSIKR